MDADGKQLVISGDMTNTIELGIGGSELIITTRSKNGVKSKTLGSREFLRYYRQKLRPTPANYMAITASLASRSSFIPCLISFIYFIYPLMTTK